MYSPKPEASFGSTHTNSVANQQQMELAGNNMGPSNGANNNNNLAARQRLRWTNELHERFVEAVTQLGGPDSMCSCNSYATISSFSLILVNTLG